MRALTAGLVWLTMFAAPTFAQRVSAGVYPCATDSVGAVTRMMRTGRATWRCVPDDAGPVRVDTVRIVTPPETVYVARPDPAAPAPVFIEPAGLTTLFDAEPATIRTKVGAWSVQSGDGPRSPPEFVRVLYSAGMPGGGGAANLEQSFAASRTLYISAWLRFSPNFESHTSGVNKTAHIWVCGRNKVVPIARGTSLVPVVALQGLSSAYSAPGIVGSGTESVHLLPNVASTTLTRGQWHRWEMLFTVNTPGAADGTAAWWVDGKKIGEYRGITYCDSGAFTQVNWNPTWGGVGGTVANTMWLDLDHLRVSGR